MGLFVESDDAFFAKRKLGAKGKRMADRICRICSAKTEGNSVLCKGCLASSRLAKKLFHSRNPKK